MTQRPTHSPYRIYPHSRASATSFGVEWSECGALPNDKAVTSADLHPHPAGPLYCSVLLPSEERVSFLTLLKVWEHTGRS